MLARMLLAVLLMIPATAFAKEEPLPEVLSRSFLIDINWINPLGTDSLYTVSLPNGSEIQVPAERFRYVKDTDSSEPTAHARALVVAMVATNLTNEIDRIRRDWKTFQDFQFGRYRPEKGAGRVRADYTVAVFVRDEIHQMDLEATWNPHHDKD